MTLRRMFATLLVGFVCCTVLHAQSDHNQPSKVEVVKTLSGWQLLRNGEPYAINGAGGPGIDGPLPVFIEAGGNSTRTWGVDHRTDAHLDQAHEHDISVVQGLWLEHPAEDVDYENLDQMIAQTEKVMADVKRLKDHPALLIWGLGNEMENEGDNAAVYMHIETLARRIKEVDPNHPVMTVIAEIGGRKVEAIHKLCPSVDIIGINTYGGAPSIPKRYREIEGVSKPYMVTEFGPLGTWEVGTNEFGAIPEWSSTKKADWYRKSVEALKADTEFCLGAYAFLWGWKQEATATWFDMFTKDGMKTAAVDVMAENWSGKAPANLCPRIEKFELQGGNQRKANEVIELKLAATDPEGRALNVRWVVMDEAEYETGGFKQEEPKVHEDCVASADATGAKIKLPDVEGIVRIYAFVDDGQNACATANVPVLVSADET